MTPNRLFLQDRFFSIFGCLTFVSILGLAQPAVLPLAVAGFLALGWAVLLDLRSLPDPRSFQVRLVHPRTPELGERLCFSSSVIVQARSPGPRKLVLSIPGLERVSFSSEGTPLQPDPDSPAGSYRAELWARAVRLGFERVEAVTLRSHSRWGLWLKRMNVSVESSEYRVMPERHSPVKLSFSELSAAQRLIYQGTHRLTRSREADQVHSLREYRYPDSIRHVDQKRSAKFNRLMTRIYDEHHNRHLIMGLDLGRSMRGDMEGSSKHDYHLSACLLLAQYAFSVQDHVSFFAFSQKVHYLIPRTKVLGPFRPLFQGHPGLYPREEESDYDLLNHTVTRIAGQRSIVLIFSDASRHSVQRALETSLTSLSGAHLCVVVTLVDDAQEPDRLLLEMKSPVSVESYAGLLYALSLQEDMDLFQRRLDARGAAALFIPRHSWIHLVMRLYGLLRESYAI